MFDVGNITSSMDDVALVADMFIERSSSVCDSRILTPNIDSDVWGWTS